MPDLDIDYHYKINADFENRLGLWPKDKPAIGITMASMRGIRAWNAWLPETWAEWIKLAHKDFPEAVFVFLGGKWDVDTMLELSGLLDDKVKIIDLVGQTTLPEAFKVLNECNYFIGYSSGLTVIRTVLDKCCCTLWPKHQYELMYSWADPKMFDSRDYMGFVYDNPERVYVRVKAKLREAINGLGRS
jgi:ADP-heptose:LPS heptosyltransferase